MTQTATKTVQVIARIAFKRNPKAVTYIVRSSDGQSTYETTIYSGKAVNCKHCPGWMKHHKCYHATGCESLEARRAEQVLTPALAGYDVIGAALRVVNDCLNGERAGDAYELLAAMRTQGVGCEFCGKAHQSHNCPF